MIRTHAQTSDHSATDSDQSAFTLRSTAVHIQLLRSGSVVVLDIAGHVPGAACDQLREMLDCLIGAGGREITLHLGSIEALDTECIQILESARSRLARIHGQLTVTAVSAQTRDALERAASGYAVPLPTP